MVVASSAGGMEIEEIAHDKPETLILAPSVEPARRHAGLPGARDRLRARPGAGLIAARRSRRILGCYRAFRELDATMVEINPLIVTEEGGCWRSTPR